MPQKFIRIASRMSQARAILCRGQALVKVLPHNDLTRRENIEENRAWLAEERSGFSFE